MPHISRKPLKKEVWARVFDLFLEGVALTKSTKEAKLFVTGFLTPTEQIMLAKRFAVFFLLEKKVAPVEIGEVLNITLATIRRIDLWRKTLSEQQKKLIRRLLRRKEIRNLLVDTFKEFYYGRPIPPYGVDWREWWREKVKWEKEQKNPLR